MKMTFHIDPEEGTEAVAELADGQFQVLLRIVMWELAMRTSPESFEDHLRDMAEIRRKIEGDIVASRRARDQRRFVASVLGDIEKLPTTQNDSPELTTGLYL
jgi:hypothetical protein